MTKNLSHLFMASLSLYSSGILAEENILKTLVNKSIYDISLSNDSRYDSNPLFQSDSTGVFRNTTNAILTLKNVYDTSELHFSGGLSVIRSSQPDVFFNQELPQFSADWIKYWEKDYLDLRAEYIESSARSTELRENGLLFTDNKREYKAINAIYVKELTPSWTLNFDANQSYTDYQKAGNGLIANDIFKTGVVLKKTLKENLTAIFNATYTDFQPESLSAIKTQGYTVGFDWWLNDQTNFSLNVGKSYSSTQDSATGSIYSFQFNRLSERTNINLDLSQSTTPSGLGILILNNRMSATVTHDINQLWSANFNISRTRNENSGLFATSVFYNAEVGLSRQLSDDLKFRVFTGIQQIDRGDKETSEVAGLSITYSFSR